MKNSKIKYILLTFALILICSLFFFLKSETAKAGYEHNVYQWVWSENIGWFSLNNVNCIENEQCDPQGEENYGLNVDYDAKTASGLAWSEHTGWICFGDSCKEVDWNLDGEVNDEDSWGWTPPIGNLAIKYQTGGDIPPNIGRVSQGWARILNLGRYGKNEYGFNNWGWVSLTSKNAAPGEDYEYWVQIDLISRLMEGWAWSGDGSYAGGTVTGSGYGWIAFRYTPETVPIGKITGRVTDAVTGDPIGGINIYAYIYQATTGPDGTYELADVKYGTYTVTAFDPAGVYSAFSKPVTLDEDIETVDFELYKAIYEECYEEISGFVFYDEDGDNIFDEDDEEKYDGAFVLIPGANYLQTTPAPSGLPKGEYKCPWEEGGRCACEGLDYTIISWYTDGTLELFGTISVVAGTLEAENANVPLKKGVAPQITGPWLQTWWSDVRAEEAIDVSANPAPGYANATYLITAANEINRFTSYGKELGWRKALYPTLEEKLGFPTEISVFSPLDIDRLIATVPADHLITDESKSADDFNSEGIWYREGDLELTGGDFDEGAKTIIVDGDLTITGDVTYESDLFAPENLPSVGFIVRGNVTVIPEVAHIVGAFYVDKDREGHGPDDDPRAGVITITSTGIKTTEKQFVCEGLMVARKFEFLREITDEPRDLIIGGETVWHYPELAAPSEVVWYDGRVVINTPKGFEDFVKALPAWEER